VTGASFGLQAGGASTDLVLVGLNKKSLEDLLKAKVKLGGEAAVAAGPVGRESQAATTELLNAEFLTYSRSKGLFAGVDLSGDEVHQSADDTQAFYGKYIPYREILTGQVPVPLSAIGFVAIVNEMFHRARAREGSHATSSGPALLLAVYRRAGDAAETSPRQPIWPHRHTASTAPSKVTLSVRPGFQRVCAWIESPRLCL
jgi:hypothetical protein